MVALAIERFRLSFPNFRWWWCRSLRRERCGMDSVSHPPDVEGESRSDSGAAGRAACPAGGRDSGAAHPALAPAGLGIRDSRRSISWRSTKRASTSCCGPRQRSHDAAARDVAREESGAKPASARVERRIARWSGFVSRRSSACRCCTGWRWRAGGLLSRSRPVIQPRRIRENQRPRGISVVIPSRNGRELLEQCLPGIQDADEIIVVDNGSDDGTAEYLGRSWPKVVDRAQSAAAGVLRGGESRHPARPLLACVRAQ